MFGIGPATRIYLAAGPTDMRKGFEGLFGLVRDRLDPPSTSDLRPWGALLTKSAFGIGDYESFRCIGTGGARSERVSRRRRM